MKKLKLLSIFSVLLLGMLPNATLSAKRKPIKDVAEKQGTLDSKKVYFHNKVWKYGNYHEINADLWANITTQDDQPGQTQAQAQSPAFASPALESVVAPCDESTFHPKDQTTSTDLSAIVEAFNSWFSQREEQYRYNFNVLYTRCPAVQQFLQESIDSYGITQETLDDIVEKAWQLMNVDQALIDLVAELPENSVYALDNLVNIFTAKPEWIDNLQQNPGVRAYFKKYAIDQASAQRADSIEKIEADAAIAYFFPETLCNKCVAHPQLFDTLIAEGKAASDFATFLHNVAILGEKLTPNQILQIENSDDIHAQFALTCNYIAIEEAIHKWIHENISDDAELYVDLVHDFFNNESLQDFFTLCFNYEEQQLTDMINNFFELIFETQDPSFAAFYTALVSSVIFESTEHFSLVLGQKTYEYFYALFTTTPRDMINSDVFVTLLNNPFLCECLQDENNWVLIDFIKNLIEHCDDTQASSLFLLDNATIFNQIITFVATYWEIIQDPEKEQPQFKNSIISILSDLISYLAGLDALTDRGFAEWIYATVPTTTDDHVQAYIDAVITDDFSNIDTENNWPGRVALLKHHDSTVEVLKHVALMLNINSDISAEDLNTFLTSYQEVIQTISPNTQEFLATCPDIVNWIFGNDAQDVLNRAAMIENMIAYDKELVEKIRRFPRLARLICNNQVTTEQELKDSYQKYAHNDDVDMALRFGLYEFKYTSKDCNEYPVEKLFGGKFKELTDIVTSCAGVDGWFYTTCHSDYYLATAIQTIMNWLLTGFYNKPELDWTDPNLNPRIQRFFNNTSNTCEDNISLFEKIAQLVGIKKDKNYTNFRFLDSELLHYAVYDAALFNFVMNNPEACIYLSGLITSTEATQETFTQEAVRLTQQQSNAGQLANTLIKTFIHARTIENIIEQALSFFGNFTINPNTPAFDQALQGYIDWANTQIAENTSHAQQLGDTHLAMITDILNGEAQEKTFSGRYKASWRWAQKYHPTATKITITGAAIVSNALITTGKVIASATSPWAVAAQLGQQVAEHMFDGIEPMLKVTSFAKTALFTLLKSILSASVYKGIAEQKILNKKDFTTLNNITFNWILKLGSVVTTSLLQAQKEIVSINPELQDEVTFKRFCKELALQFLRSLKDVLLNFAFNNGGWRNCLKALTINNNEIRFGKKQAELKEKAFGDLNNCLPNLFFICKAITSFFPEEIDGTCTALVDPNPEQGPTHVDGYNEIAPEGYSKTIKERIKNLGYAPEQGQSAQAILEGIRSCLRQDIPGTQNHMALVDPATFNTGATARSQGHIAIATPQPISENARRWNVMEREMAAHNASTAPVEAPVQEDEDWGWVIEAANANNASTALVDPGSEIVDIPNDRVFSKNLGDDPQAINARMANSSALEQEGFVQEDGPSTDFKKFFEERAEYAAQKAAFHKECIDKIDNFIAYKTIYKTINCIKSFF